MSDDIKAIRDAILAEEPAATSRTIESPESYRGMLVREDETGLFEGLATRDKDPRRSLHLDEVPTPELGPG